MIVISRNKYYKITYLLIMMMMSGFASSLYAYEETGSVILIHKESNTYYEGDVLDKNRILNENSYYEFLELGKKRSVFLEPQEYEIVTSEYFENHRSKRRYKAVLRSMLVPGWGSYYGQDKIWKMGAYAGAFAYLALSAHYENQAYIREKQMRDETPFVYPILIPIRTRHDVAAREHYKNMKTYSALAVVLYLTSLVDAWFAFDDYGVYEKGSDVRDFRHKETGYEGLQYAGLRLSGDTSNNFQMGVNFRF